ncbi:hypothetical protein L1049_019490 [Liquidambar formosana]|uniref:Uncharacterized protein n=1 Tax=Liquidambar formosana TaxID=63359 RepID=A0AAP0SBG1_LIQFO
MDVCDLREASTLVGCSLRDLMRRKRCYRVEQPEIETPRVKKVLPLEEQKTDTFLCSKQFEFHTLQNKGHDMRPLESFNFRSLLTDQGTEFHEACDVKPTSDNFSMYGELPLLSSTDVPLHSDTVEDGHFAYCGKVDDKVVSGVVGSCKLHNFQSPS